MTHALGAVLAGGRSSRFGSDKAMAVWRGRPLIDHAIDALRPMVDDLVICGRTHGDIVAITDLPAPDMGPLGGLNAALHHAQAQGFDLVLSVGCDTPLLPPALLERLLGAPGPAYVANLPVIGCWPVGLAGELDTFLRENRKHAIRAWAASVSAEPIDWPTLANVNEPADLRRL